MADAALTGSEFKKQLRAGTPKMGLFVNSHSPTIAEQLAHSGYDWLLVDTQHGPTWALMASSFPTSTPPKKRARPSVAPSTPRSARARFTFRSAA